MTVLEQILIEEYERSKKQKELAKKVIKESIKGNIKKQIIKGNEYYYLQWREADKIKSKYIKKNELDNIKQQILRRNEAKKMLKTAKKDLKMLERALDV